jgi:hypothetical protein
MGTDKIHVKGLKIKPFSFGIKLAMNMDIPGM